MNFLIELFISTVFQMLSLAGLANPASSKGKPMPR
jgi:hypothetical protein